MIIIMMYNDIICMIWKMIQYESNNDTIQYDIDIYDMMTSTL